MDPNSGRIYDLSDPDLPDDIRQNLLEIRTPEPAFWNGLPTTAIRGQAIVDDAPEFPQYWAKDLVGQRIGVVRVDLEGVNYGGGIVYLDNRDGSGWAKVTTGGGAPQFGHREVVIVEGSFITDSEDVERVREANRKLLLETETQELGEILEEMERIKTMPSGPPEQFFSTNRAARRKADRRNRALKKRKPNGQA